MRIPFMAPTDVPTMMAVGVARPNAQGQLMTGIRERNVNQIIDIRPLKYETDAFKCEGDRQICEGERILGERVVSLTL